MSAPELIRLAIMAQAALAVALCACALGADATWQPALAACTLGPAVTGWLLNYALRTLEPAPAR